VVLCLRPEDFLLQASGGTSWAGRVKSVFVGAETAEYVVEWAGPAIIARGADKVFEAGAAVSLAVKPGRMKLYAV
jgi:hypothetical protein